LWNGGGADGSRTVNPRAFDQFAEVVEQVVDRYSGNRDWIVMFGISRGAATALGMASNPYEKDYRVVLSVAEAPPTRYGTHASLVGPTYPGLLKAAGWHTGLADSWRSNWIYPSCGRPELAGKDGVPAALQIATGSSDPLYVDQSLSLVSETFLAGLAQAGTQVQLVVTGNDDICPTHLQSQYARALMEQGIPVDLRLAVRMGHARLVIPGQAVALSDQTVAEAAERLSDPSLDLDGPVPKFITPRVALYRVDRSTETMVEFVPSDGLAPFTIDFPWVVAWGQRIPVAATGEPGTAWRLSLDPTTESLEGSVGEDGTDTVWLDVPDSLPAGVYGCSLEIRKPGQAAFSVIPATSTPTGEACAIKVEESEPDVDYVEAYKRAKGPALSKFRNTCWGLSEY
jgi:acetyl esterase/lipase